MKHSKQWWLDFCILLVAFIVGIALLGFCVLSAYALDGGPLPDNGIAQATVQPAVQPITPPSGAPPIPWVLYSSVIIAGLMSLLKRQGILAKIGRWRYIVLPILSIASVVLAEWAETRSIISLIVIFFGNYCTGQLEELINHGILGTPHTQKGDKV